MEWHILLLVTFSLQSYLVTTFYALEPHNSNPFDVEKKNRAHALAPYFIYTDNAGMHYSSKNGNTVTYQACCERGTQESWRKTGYFTSI